jgi:hypothetical protein
MFSIAKFPHDRLSNTCQHLLLQHLKGGVDQVRVLRLSLQHSAMQERNKSICHCFIS